MEHPFLDQDDVLSGVQRLDLAISKSLIMPGEADVIRTILGHLVVADTAMRNFDTGEDDQESSHNMAVLTLLLDSCLTELARFGH